MAAGVVPGPVGRGRPAPCVGGVTNYVEVGPGTVLSSLVKKIHKEAIVHNFAAPDDLAAIEAALGR